MKRIITIGIVLFAFSGVPLAHGGQTLTAESILSQVDDLLDLNNSILTMEMKIFRDNTLQKSYQLHMDYKDWDNMKTEITYPPRNKGQVMLQTGDNMWLYLPRINKTMRISERNSFSNSDFSNTDILNARLGDDYTPILIGEETLDEQETYKLELTAKSPDVTYAKIHYWIRKKDLFPVRRDYYTFSGHLLKRLILNTQTGIRGDKPDTFIMTSILEKNKQTILKYLDVKPCNEFPSLTFSKNSLMK